MGEKEGLLESYCLQLERMRSSMERVLNYGSRQHEVRSKIEMWTMLNEEMIENAIC